MAEEATPAVDVADRVGFLKMPGGWWLNVGRVVVAYRVSDDSLHARVAGDANGVFLSGADMECLLNWLEKNRA